MPLAAVFFIGAVDGHHRFSGPPKRSEAVIRAGTKHHKHDQFVSLFALAGPVPARATRTWMVVRSGAVKHLSSVVAASGDFRGFVTPDAAFAAHKLLICKERDVF